MWKGMERKNLGNFKQYPKFNYFINDGPLAQSFFILPRLAKHWLLHATTKAKINKKLCRRCSRTRIQITETVLFREDLDIISLTSIYKDI